jgi:hypothetical protein
MDRKRKILNKKSGCSFCIVAFSRNLKKISDSASSYRKLLGPNHESIFEKPFLSSKSSKLLEVKYLTWCGGVRYACGLKFPNNSWKKFEVWTYGQSVTGVVTIK